MENEKKFKGKAIYNPSGKAGEYSHWACNFYTGCSNDCKYCYCKRGVMSHVWSDKPRLKRCFADEKDALEVFERELMQNLSALQEYGLFFTFTSDPMLPETIQLTIDAIRICVYNSVDVKILTKRADFAERFFRPLCSKSSLNEQILHIAYTKHVAFGFTLTGHDELEPNASTNEERINAMKILHEGGYKTWASIEPVIDLDASFAMICRSMEYCDLFKIGLESGKTYPKKELVEFIEAVSHLNHTNPYPDGIFLKIYFKDGLLSQAGIVRENLPENCVSRDYNIFK